MRRRLRNTALASILFAGVVLAAAVTAEAQQLTKIPRIAFLGGSTASALAKRLAAFRQGLHELEYVEGKNIVIEYHYGEGHPERLPVLASKLVRSKVDIILTGGPFSTHAAVDATTKIPIVMAFDNDPIGNGFAASLARPGGNVTRLSTQYPEISGKQLELLKDVLPGLTRVAVLGNLQEPGNAQALKRARRRS